ncbi:colicin V production CvpA [Capnocytophaga cynodegmi]|uniref:Colicin V production CvpA n=1 Tax=Capnocytophaga cynodegmi TaxID=28189 RepID=A0A250EA31_9FLAO|nr:CvpA family protein [Capnocytophaga cynodegmi]ATA68595.1 colicin V production CvpA [Capnocytophaga cynodegmi]
MNTVDIILLIFLGFGLIRGLWRGVIIELASLLAIVLGIYGAIHFSFYVAGILNQHLSLDKSTTEAVSFAFTLVLIMLIVMLLAKLLTKVVESVSLGFLNRLAGGIFGVLKVTIIAGSLFLMLEKTWQITKWIPEKTLQNSVLYEPIKSVGELFYKNIF